jgi:uncharacterized protein YegL
MFAKVKPNTTKIIALTVVFTCLIACWTSINAYGSANPNVDLELSRELSSEKILLDDEITINYKINLQPISKSDVEPPKKEIYLVMDTSSSMERDLNGNIIFPPGSKKARKDISTEAANKFLDNLKSKSNLKVGLVSFTTSAMIKESLTNNIDSVKQAVNALIYSTGTNIGDGMRIAYHKLKNSSADKYIILLTDGTPTYHTTKRNRPYDFYFDDGNAPRTVFGGINDKEYCYQMAERIKEQGDIKSYMIAFTIDSDSNILEQVAQKASGKYKKALDADALNDVYNEIYEDIIVDFSIDNIEFKESFPAGLSIVSVPEGFDVNGQTVTGNLEQIKYKYKSASNQYEADPVEFSITVKGSKAGSYSLDSSELSYKDANNENKTGSFGDKSVNVVAVSAPITIGRSMSKEEVLINEEFSVNYTINPGEFGIDSDLTPPEKFTVKNISFSEEFPEGLTVIPANGLTISGQNASRNIDNIVYTFDASDSKYKAAPVSFAIALKGTEGEYTLGESNSSKIEYTDLDNETKAKSFPELEPRIVKFGMPKLKVLDVVKKGETVNVQLSVDLPERTDYGQIRLENEEPVFVNGSVGIIQNIESDGSYWYNGLSIYKTHKVYLWAISDCDPYTTNQTELITIFNAIDIN